ncbi:Acyl-CoA N-acyltransferase [Amanita muscaria]
MGDPAKKQGEDISLVNFGISNGHCTDDHYNFLASLFEQLQFATYEASDLMTDFMTFVDSNTIIGMLYLTTPSEMRNNVTEINDLNLGIIIHPQYRRKGHATRALKLALDLAFKEIRCHRVQVIIINPFSEGKYPCYRLFTSTGFEQEGIRRHSYFNIFENEYQDIAYMAILDIEWLTKPKRTQASPWDELLNRHDKERQMILRWEERTNGGDSDDTKTIRAFSLDDSSECGANSTASSSRVTSRASTPGLHFTSENLQQPEGLPFSGSSSQWDLVDGFSSCDEMESDVDQPLLTE